MPDLAALAPWLGPVLLTLYTIVGLLLAVYGLNYLVLFVIRLRAPPRALAPTLTEAPMVAIQVPVYNERNVVSRLLRSLDELDWPRDRLHVQILDDSDDETTAACATWASDATRRGFSVEHRHRSGRHGFKAGALQEGLSTAPGAFVAIFDADFHVPPSFLRRTIPVLQQPRVACVQTRWGHTNEDYSWLTKSVAIGLDAHFLVEQRARAERGYPMSFNGTAVVWRRQAIDELGGWSSDTLAEDLDLTLAALCAGWRFEFVDDLAAPQELPVELDSLKRQQFRWAKGSMQNLRKHGGAVLRSHLRWDAKMEALLHASHYAINPLLVLFFLLQVANLAFTALPTWIPLVVVGLASGGPLAAIVYAQRRLHPRRWLRRLGRVVPLALLGIGISLLNTRAILEGLFGGRGTFERTAKYRIEGAHDTWKDKPYAPRGATVAWAEAGLGALAVGAAAAALAVGSMQLVPAVAFFGLGFWTVFVASLSRPAPVQAP